MHVSAAGVSSCFILLYFTLLFMLHVAQHVVTAGNILSATITTVAGTGTAGFSGDNGQATSANLRAPIGVFVRSSGEMYISDQSGSHRIRKVSSTGIINTIAGTGTNGYNGDNIAATAAQLNLPQNTFVTSSGEIYIADNTNHRIRKIDTSGKIWTVAGTGTLGTAGDGQLAKNAQLSLPRSVFVTPSGTGVQGNTGDNQLATSAQLYMPYYVFVESKSGEVYIADYYAHVIRKVKTNGIIVTIAGTGTNGYNGDNIAATSAQLDSPSCVVVSNFGEIFISDAVNNRIRKIDRSGIISTVAGTGTAAFAGDGGLPQNAQLKRPMTLSIPDGSSDIFFSDYGNLRIRKISITCQSGYGGANCDIFTCSSIPATDPTVCSGHGTCGAPNSCSCHSGYSGSNCEMMPITCYGLASTDSNVCSGHGTCTASDTCQCSWNYTGSNCELPKCNGIASNDLIHVCSGHGTCTGVDTCSCQTGYTGQFCSEAICNNKAASAPDVCHGHGSCNAPNTCLCSNNYTGSDCEIPTCYGIPSNDSRVCSGNGSCVSPQTCECNHLYGGSNCSIPKCFNLMDPTMVCSGHGTCLAPDQCQCDAQWSGIQCEIPKCYGYSATLVSNVCHGRGNCTSPDRCECTDHYAGPDCQYPKCFGLSSNDSNVCSQHGACVDVNTCHCHENYGGSNCSIPKCFGILSTNSTHVCHGRGICQSVNLCQCTNSSEYGGNSCEWTRCFEILENNAQVCSGHGTCVAPNSCQCQQGYSGTQCQTLNNYACFSKLTTDPMVCSGHGTCIAPNQCQCENNYFGETCSVTACHGIMSNESTVCNSAGICTSPNVCQCQAGYTGSTCEHVMCFGMESNRTSFVCSGHGDCVSPNHCQCHSQWTGVNCGVPLCNGMSPSNPNVCSGRGSCTSPNVCQCQAGYTGSTCEIVYCHDKLSNDPNVCSSHGTCVSPNSCQCMYGYSGSNCQVPVCFGKNANDVRNVCSGNGVCTSPNTCECFPFYSGQDCSELASLVLNTFQPSYIHVNQYHGDVYRSHTDQHSITKQVSTTIQVIAGNGVAGFSGDGALARNAQLNHPKGIFVTFSGEIYIADCYNHRIRKIDSQGIISTVVGRGNTPGMSGDFGSALNAQLSFPEHVYLSNSLELYIVDTGNHRIRKVNRNGIIQTIAGNSSSGFNGDSLLALDAQLNTPKSVAVDSLGQVFIADCNNHRIRKINVAGMISTVVGDGIGGEYLMYPTSVFVTNQNELLVTDSGHNRTVFINSNGTLSTIASSTNSTPLSVFASNNGEIFIAESTSTWVQKIFSQELTISKGIISTIAGTDEKGYSGDGDLATRSSLWMPMSVFVNHLGEVYIADTDNCVLRKIDLHNRISTLAGLKGHWGFRGDGSMASSFAQFNLPMRIFVVHSTNMNQQMQGQIFMVDSMNHRIRAIHSDGIISTIVGVGESGFSGDGGLATKAKLNYPISLFVTSYGEIFIADLRNSRIRKVDSNGMITTVVGSGQIGYNGEDILAIHAHLQYPHSVHVSQFGEIYIADTYNFRIRKVNTEGIISTIAGVGEMGFSGDGGQAIHAKISNCESLFVTNEGEVFFTDTFNNRIRKIDVNGIISTIAGVGESGFSGDGGQAIDAKFQYPHSVFVSNMGEVFVADSCNHRIRKFQL